MSPADKISLYFPSIKVLRVFCQKEEDLLPLFHKMLEGPYCSKSMHLNVGMTMIVIARVCASISMEYDS